MIFLDFRAEKTELLSTAATAAGGLTFTGRKNAVNYFKAVNVMKVDISEFRRRE